MFAHHWIRYALGDHQGALDRLEEVQLDSLPLTDDISSRKMKLVGECFAIKGCQNSPFIYCVISLTVFLAQAVAAWQEGVETIFFSS